MIRVYFYYWKVDGFNKRWEKGEKSFNSVESASKFCWSMKNNKHLVLDGWSCDDPEDNQEMNIKVNIAKINGWKV